MFAGDLDPSDLDPTTEATVTDDKQERIRQRAHEIWEQAGRPEGSHMEHWDRATAEIDGAAVKPKKAAAKKPAAAAKPAKAAAAKAATAKTSAAKPKAGKPAAGKPKSGKG
jgi:DUF2934 family protein